MTRVGMQAEQEHTMRDERGDREERRARREKRKEAGQRKPEWRCPRCQATNFVYARTGGLSTQCRRCDREKDARCAEIDCYGVEHPGANWPTVAEASGKTSRAKTPPRSPGTGTAAVAQKGATSAGSEVQRWHEQIKAAKNLGMPEEAIAVLRGKLEGAQQAMQAGQTIGKRLDMARNKLRDLTDTLETAEHKLEKLNLNVEEIRGDVREAYAALRALLQEEAVDKHVQKPKDMIGVGFSDVAGVLTRLTAAVRDGWPKTSEAALPLVPREVVEAMKEAETLQRQMEKEEEVDLLQTEQPEPPEKKVKATEKRKQTEAKGEDVDEVMGSDDASLEAPRDSPPPSQPRETEPEPPKSAAARPGSIRETIEKAEKLVPALREDRSRSPMVARGTVAAVQARKGRAASAEPASRGR